MKSIVTKKMAFIALKDYLHNVDNLKAINGIPINEIINILDSVIISLEKKTIRDKIFFEKNKRKEDPLKEEIKKLLTKDFQTIDDISCFILSEDATKAKISARLNQLVQEGLVIKEEKRIDGRKLIAYKYID